MIASGEKVDSTRSEVFDSRHRALTLGILLTVTLVAFEGLAVVTVAPRFAEALGGLSLYGWVFSGFLLASLLGTVAGGQQADRHGPGRARGAGLVLFGAGLLLSGFAPSMWLLIVGRILQGLGGGALATSMYVVVTLAYPDSMRPRMMALMSSAWVLPALIGPSAAGALAQAVSWRWVFLGMLPLPALVALLTLPAFRRLSRGNGRTDEDRLLPALRLVAGTGLLLFGLTLARPLPILALVFAGVWLGAPALPRLLPSGTLRLRRGLPAVVAARGLFYAGFVGVEVFLSLMLTSVHGYAPVITGIAIATGAVSWTAGSWLQDRLEGRVPRQRRVLVGTSVLMVGLAVQLLALYASASPLLVSIAGWVVAGLGIGLAHASDSVLAFALAPEGEAGAVSAALQLADNLAAALSTGVGGALFALALATGASEQSGISAAFLASLVLVALSVVAAWRIGREGSLAVRVDT